MPIFMSSESKVESLEWSRRCDEPFPMKLQTLVSSLQTLVSSLQSPPLRDLRSVHRSPLHAGLLITGPTDVDAWEVPESRTKGCMELASLGRRPAAGPAAREASRGRGLRLRQFLPPRFDQRGWLVAVLGLVPAASSAITTQASQAEYCGKD